MNLSSAHHIDHAGFISAIRKGVAYVTLIQASACASCGSKALCGVGESEKKQFEIPVSGSQWHVGDEVLVRINTSTGLLAMVVGYLIPFLLVVVVLLVVNYFTRNEGTSAVVALLSLIPYYISLRLLRRYLASRMNMKIIKR